MQRCGGSGPIKEKFESLDRFGSPELTASSDNEPTLLAGRDAVIRELKERVGVRAIAQAQPKYDSASGGKVENASHWEKKCCELW